MASSKISDAFLTTLSKIAGMLTEENINSIALLCENTESENQRRITDATELFSKLQELDLLSERRVDVLRQSLENLQIPQAVQTLDNFRKKYFNAAGEPKEQCSCNDVTNLLYYCIACDFNICSACSNRFHKSVYGCDVIEIREGIASKLKMSEKCKEELNLVEDLCDVTKVMIVEKKERLLECSKKYEERVRKEKQFFKEKTEACAVKLLTRLSDSEKEISGKLEIEEEKIIDMKNAIEKIEKQHTRLDYDISPELRELNNSKRKIGNIRTALEKQQENLKELNVDVVYISMPNDEPFASFT